MKFNSLIIFLSILLLSVSSVSAFSGGDGTEGDPFQISTPEHLQNMSADLSAHYILVNDIDMNISPYNQTVGFNPIGTFSGSFNGDGFTVSNLFINSTSGNTGLFTLLSGSVSNLVLEDVNITGTSAV
ncbi:MAG: peptidase A26, partial [Nanoarchaeota archaeon]|nr:peptidase A26 [Nanoarchaeota archaeon]